MMRRARGVVVAPPPRIVLLPEPVPETAWFINLRSALSTPCWSAVSRWQGRLARWRCQACGGKGPEHPVECHEQWSYETHGREHVQRLVGLLALCPACHQVKHIGLAQLRGQGEAAWAHFLRVNNIDDAQGRDIMMRLVDEYEERSRVKWRQDISWIEGWSAYHKIALEYVSYTSREYDGNDLPL